MELFLHHFLSFLPARPRIVLVISLINSVFKILFQIFVNCLASKVTFLMKMHIDMNLYTLKLELPFDSDIYSS